MGKRRKFTNEFKVEAVQLAERGGITAVTAGQSAEERGWRGRFGSKLPKHHNGFLRFGRNDKWEVVLRRDRRSLKVGGAGDGGC